MKKLFRSSLLFFLSGIILFSSFFGAVLQVSAADAIGSTGVRGTGAEFSTEGYTPTSYLNDTYKEDSTQKNYQEAELDSEDIYYTTSLLQTAEWTDKADGEAAVQIHYAADFSEIELRSLYVFTTCTGHSFSLATAVTNIIQLLEYNDYVDVIMIGANNRRSNYYEYGSSDEAIGDAAAALMVTVRASDFTDCSDDEKTTLITTIFETHTNKALINNSNAHVIGCGSSEDDCCVGGYTLDTSATDENGVKNDRKDGYYFDGTYDSYGPYIEVLYNYAGYPFYFTYANSEDKTDEKTYESAADLVLTFGDQRHAGELFTLYYIAKYIDIIENERELDFSTTVQAIFNSFDSFATASRNMNDIFETTNLYDELNNLYGTSFGEEGYTFKSSDLNSDCAYALEVLGNYTTESRYIVLIPDYENASGIYTYPQEDINNLDSQQLSSLKNTLVFTLRVMNPNTENYTTATGTVIPGHTDDEIWTVVNTLIRQTSRTTDTGDDDTSGASGSDGTNSPTEEYYQQTESTDISYELLQVFNPNIYTYTNSIGETGALNIVYEVINTVTITAVITGEFEITDETKIVVSNSNGPTTYFDYIVTIEEDASTGGTKVTIYCYNLIDNNNEEISHITGEPTYWGTSWSIDVSIPVQLVDNTEFRTSDDDFKETNIATVDTTATVERQRIIYRVDSTTMAYTQLGTEDFAETVTVESPKLYKYGTDDTEDPDGSDDPKEPVETNDPEDTENTVATSAGYSQTTSDTDGTTTSETASPQTGDDSNIALWIVLMLAAGASLTGTILYSRKKKYSR